MSIDVAVIGTAEGWVEFRQGLAGQSRQWNEGFVRIGSVRYIWIHDPETLRGMTFDHFFALGNREQWDDRLIQSLHDAREMTQRRFNATEPTTKTSSECEE